MKPQLKIVLAIMLLSAISVAQDAPKHKNQATRDAGGSGTEAQSPGMVEKQPVPNAAAAKPNATGEAHEFTETEKRGYALGVELGSDIARQAIEVNPHLLTQGIMDSLTGGKLLMTVEDMNATLAALQKEQRQKMALAVREFAEKNKKDGEAFLAANKAKEGIVALPSGLQYKVLKAGNGKKPTLDDQVVCHYRGTLLDGTEVDSSYTRNEPSTFPLKGVIKGWTEALQLMPVGSKWQIFMPPDLAYGERGTGRNIGPNATLIFEVELISIQEKSQDQANPTRVTIGQPRGSQNP
jgi:FKBP-type peptidyl-prolyl cis-trans isomerase FklB